MPLDSYFSRNSLKLAPNTSNRTLHEIFSILEAPDGQNRVLDWLTELARVVAHPNSDSDLIEQFFAKTRGTPLPFLGFHDAKSEFVEKLQFCRVGQGDACRDHVAAAPDCAASTLAWAYRSGEGEGDDADYLVTHKNFPWKEFAFSDVCKRMLPQRIPLVRAAKFLNTNASEEEIVSAIDAGFSREVLFAQNLSAKRLNKIASCKPELAVLAAIHPNAENVAFPKEYADVVSRCRPPRFEVLLGGRTESQGVPAPHPRLEI